jgi:D-serine deaminase-like pyridoxal phosphate-dependent protein
VSRSGSQTDLRRFDTATAALDPPFAIVDMAAFRANAATMVRRAGGKPIRLASKSVRCRYLIERVLELDGFRGILAYTLPEALWLASARTSDDIVVAYPTVDRAALARLVGGAGLASAITVMVDCPEHLDLIDKVAAGVANPHPVRVAIDIDAGYVAAGCGQEHAARRSVPRPMQSRSRARSCPGPACAWPG